MTKNIKVLKVSMFQMKVFLIQLKVLLLKSDTPSNKVTFEIIGVKG